METITNKGLSRFGTILALGLIIVALIAAGTFYRSKSFQDTVSVTGSSQISVRSDMVKWRSNFSRTVAIDDLQDGYARMKWESDTILQYLKQNKIAENEITINPVSIYPQYQQDSFGSNGKVIGYNLTQTVIVESGDIDTIIKIAKDSGVLINQGIIFASDPLEFYYSKLNDLKLDLLADATKNAKERAEKIAASSGSAVGSLRSAAVGVFQVTPINSTEISDYGYYDTSSVDKQVTAVVRASFSLR